MRLHSTRTTSLRFMRGQLFLNGWYISFKPFAWHDSNDSSVCFEFENWCDSRCFRKGSIDERLHRLRAVTQGVIAARKFRRSSSIQGKYVAITPNERDNLEHIQHMTEDITARFISRYHVCSVFAESLSLRRGSYSQFRFPDWTSCVITITIMIPILKKS